MRALVSVCIKEEVSHAHAQNAPLEWFLSTPRASRYLREKRIRLFRNLGRYICQSGERELGEVSQN